MVRRVGSGRCNAVVNGAIIDNCLAAGRAPCGFHEACESDCESANGEEWMMAELSCERSSDDAAATTGKMEVGMEDGDGMNR